MNDEAKQPEPSRITSFFQTEAVDREDLPSPNETDSLIAKQLASLSMRDREQVYYDLHGVTDEIKETPELIEESLNQLEVALDNIKEKIAYHTAKSRNNDYVMNRNFRLKFLRAERFDSKAAALRLVKHFEVKLELFGKEMLCKDIVQDDLDEATLKELYIGYHQILPSRDRAGRLVFVYFPGHRTAPPDDELALSIVSASFTNFVLRVLLLMLIWLFLFSLVYVVPKNVLYSVCLGRR